MRKLFAFCRQQRRIWKYWRLFAEKQRIDRELVSELPPEEKQALRVRLADMKREMSRLDCQIREYHGDLVDKEYR